MLHASCTHILLTFTKCSQLGKWKLELGPRSLFRFFGWHFLRPFPHRSHQTSETIMMKSDCISDSGANPEKNPKPSQELGGNKSHKLAWPPSPQNFYLANFRRISIWQKCNRSRRIVSFRLKKMRKTTCRWETESIHSLHCRIFKRKSFGCLDRSWNWKLNNNKGKKKSQKLRKNLLKAIRLISFGGTAHIQPLCCPERRIRAEKAAN